MDRKLRKILTECIRDVETGARDIEGCLQRHPDRAGELRPHLELWSGLDAAAKARPNFGSQQRGQQQLLGALADMEKRGEKRMIPFLTPALAKAAAVVAGVVLLAGGAAGASAALGGPDVGGQVLSTMGINNAPDAAQTGKDHANPNAFEGSGNAGQGIDNASETGREHANEQAGDDAGVPDDVPPGDVPDDVLPGIVPDDVLPGDVPDDVLPGDVPDDVLPGDVPPDGAPPEDVPPDSVPDSAPVPDSVPVAPQP